MRKQLSILTNSGEKTFRACQKLYWYQYEQMYRPIITAEPLAVGTLQHLALEAWWLAAQAMPARDCPECDGRIDLTNVAACAECDGTGIYGPKEWLRAALLVLAGERDEYRRAAAEALMVGYHNRWHKMQWEGAPYDGAPLEVLGVEVEFNGPLLNPRTDSPSKSWQRGGKIDVLIRVRGDVWVLDHKVTSEDFTAGSDYRRKLRLDTQISGYHVGARMLTAGPVAGFVYDVISRPAQKPLKATPTDKRKYTVAKKDQPSRLYAGQRAADETPDEFQARVLEAIAGDLDGHFARFEVTRLAEEERLAAQDTWQYGEMIRDARRLNRWPRNPSACTSHGRGCSFLPCCEGTATLADGTRYRKAETAHEELGVKPANDGERTAA